MPYEISRVFCECSAHVLRELDWKFPSLTFRLWNQRYPRPTGKKSWEVFAGEA